MPPRGPRAPHTNGSEASSRAVTSSAASSRAAEASRAGSCPGMRAEAIGAVAPRGVLVGQIGADHALPGRALDLLRRVILAGQQTRCEGEVGEQRHVGFAGERPVAVLHVAPVQQVVLRLERHGAGEALPVGVCDPLPLAVHGEVRQSDVAHHPLADQRVEGACHVLDALGLVVEVGVVQVDAVRAETLQGGPCRGRDGGRGEPVELGMGGHLGGDQDPVAAAAGGEPASDDRLGLAAVVAGRPVRVAVGGVDERTAGRDEGVEHGEGGPLVARPAEGVGAQDEREDVDVGPRDPHHGGPFQRVASILGRAPRGRPVPGTRRSGAPARRAPRGSRYASAAQ